MSGVQKKPSYKKLKWINNWWSKLAIQDYSPKKIWFFHHSRANKREKTVSNCLRNKKRFLLFPNRKDRIYYKCFQIKKKIFIIGNRCCQGTEGKKCHKWLLWGVIWFLKFLDLLWWGGRDKVWNSVLFFFFFFFFFFF